MGLKLASLVLLVASMAPATDSIVLSETALLERGTSAYDHGEFARAHVYLYAYVQRSPARMAKSQAHRASMLRALEWLDRWQDSGEGAYVKGDDPGATGMSAPPSLAAASESSAPDPEARKIAGGFVGVFEGPSDGRRARLTVRKHSDDSLALELHDLDRKTVFSGSVRPNLSDPGHAHVLRDFTLKARDGSAKRFGVLLLHTWDSDFVSGTTIWGGREFGVAFERTE